MDALEFIFGEAKRDLKAAEELQPGEWLLHLNDAGEVLDTLQKRVRNLIEMENQ